MIKKNEDKKLKEMKIDRNFLVSMLVAFMTVILCGMMSVTKGIDYLSFMINCIFVAFIYSVFMIIIRRTVPVSVIVMILTYLLMAVNENILLARSTPLQYSDFFCIGDAFNVASSYSVTFTPKMVIYLFVIVLWVVLALIFGKKFLDEKKIINFTSSMICTVLLALYIIVLKPEQLSMAMGFDINTFTNSNGLVYALYVEYKNSDFDEPKNYSPQKADEISLRYLSDECGSDTGEEYPNVIVIMNEAFCDMSTIVNYEMKEDALEYYHSLKENCIKGDLLVSIRGGLTCNTEYEFLTGNSLAFVPYNTIPFIQYIKGDIDSVAKAFRKCGYNSYAFHPFLPQEWRRENVYDLMGFQKFYSGYDLSGDYKAVSSEDITNTNLRDLDVNFGSELDYVREFISDRENYNFVIDKLENKEDDKPLFMFNVTIQNHGGYEGNDFDKVIVEDNEQLNNYMNLIDISDDAFKEFIEYLKEYDEKTVVLMFGDHQPGIPIDFDKPEYFKGENIKFFEQSGYLTSYIMWANYDVDWKEYSITSPNFLSAILKQNAGLPLDSWDKFRLEVMDTYPAINSMIKMDTNKAVSVSSDISDDSVLYDYSVWQTKRMFDES